MERTYIEGVRLPTALESHHPSSRNQAFSARDTPGRAQTASHQAHPNHTNQTAATVMEATQGPPESSRIRTARAQLGDMQRTFVEGMRLPTSFESQHPRTSTAPSHTQTPKTKPPGLVPASQYNQDTEGKSYPAFTKLVSRPPSNVRTILTNPGDQVMASSQTRISTMAPEERNRQENWAQSMIQRAGVCPQGFEWRRAEGGYHCEGKHHFISDELLAEGRSGVFVVPGGKHGKMTPLWGPYYPDPNDAGGKLVFGGDVRDNHPEWLELRRGLFHWPKIWKLVSGLRGMPKTREEKEALDEKVREIWGDPLRRILEANPNGRIRIGKKLPEEVNSDSDSDFDSDSDGSVQMSIRRSGNAVSNNGGSVHIVNGRRVPSSAGFSNRGLADSRFQPGPSDSRSRARTYRY